MARRPPKLRPLLGLETRSLTRILRSMEEKGLIYKQADSVDKRSVRIFLTRWGWRKRRCRARPCATST